MSPSELAVGATVFTAAFPVTRADLVAYADASGDQNPIHQDEAAAKAAGLPDVIAHGMFTMGLVSRAVREWTATAGLDAALADFSVRFARPVVVPAAGGAEVVVEGKIRRIEGDTIELAMTVTSAGEKVLAPARATLIAK